MKILVLFAHPRADRSEVNAPLFDVARHLDGVTAVDLYAEYPSFEIDVDREQDRLLGHDVVIFQHPLYWYSCPALLKEWQDLVLEYGFAYGPEATALSGKLFLNAVTCGGRREAYGPDGANGAHLRQLLVPFERTADLCRMIYLAPFALFGAGRALEAGLLAPHVESFGRLLEALRDDRFDVLAAQRAPILSDDLNAFIS